MKGVQLHLVSRLAGAQQPLALPFPQVACQPCQPQVERAGTAAARVAETEVRMLCAYKRMRSRFAVWTVQHFKMRGPRVPEAVSGVCVA